MRLSRMRVALDTGAAGVSINFDAEPLNSICGTETEIAHAAGYTTKGRHSREIGETDIEDVPYGITLPTLRFMRELPENWP